MKVELHKVKLLDIDGKEVKTPVHKEVANMLYAVATDLGLVDKAREIYAGKAVELTEEELDTVKGVINRKGQDGNFLFLAFARKALLDYVDQVLKAYKEAK